MLLPALSSAWARLVSWSTVQSTTVADRLYQALERVDDRVDDVLDRLLDLVDDVLDELDDRVVVVRLAVGRRLSAERISAPRLAT